MKILFTKIGWEDYLYWQTTDKPIFKRINTLIKESIRNPKKGLGKPEPLKHRLQGCWSRRIDSEYRLVYEFNSEEIIIISCRFHY